MLIKYKYKFSIIFSVSLLLFACSSNEEATVQPIDYSVSQEEVTNEEPEDETQIYAAIDFTNWKVTLPVDENNNGSPDEYQPAQLVNNAYQTLTAVQPYMYDDVSDASLVFYTFPDVSTTNSSYSRTELRELINPSNARENWSLLEGG